MEMALRDTKLDFYKGLLMFGVIWGHTITALSYQHEPVFIHQFVRLYDMPFFMLLSGFFLSKSVMKYSIKTLMANKVTQILFPTLLWSLLYSGFRSITGYYFLWSVFLSSSVTLITVYCTKNRYLQGVVFLVITFVLNSIDHTLWNMGYLFPFFAIGFMGGWEKQYDMRVVLPLFVILCCFWKPEYTIWHTGPDMFSATSSPLLVLYRYLIGFSGIMVMRQVFGLLAQTSIFNYFCQIGRETLAVYLIQAIVIEVYFKRLCMWLSSIGHPLYILNDNLMAYVVAPAISIIAMSAFMYLIRLLKMKKQTAWVFGFKISSRLA